MLQPAICLQGIANSPSTASTTLRLVVDDEEITAEVYYDVTKLAVFRLGGSLQKLSHLQVASEAPRRKELTRGTAVESAS